MVERTSRWAPIRMLLALALILTLCVPGAVAAAAFAVDVPVISTLAAPRARSLTLMPRTKTLFAGAGGQGESAQLLAVVTPEEAEPALQWKSSKSSVVSVDQTGLITAHKPGKATITVKATDGSKLSRTCRVTVKPIVPTAVTISQPSVRVAPKATVQLSYATVPADAYNQQVKWKSSHPSIAKVSSTGLVTGVAFGRTTITCTTKSGARKASVTVDVCFEGSNVYYVAIGQHKYPNPSANPQERERYYLPASAEDAKRFEFVMQKSDFGQKAMRGDVHIDLTGSEMRSVLSSLTQAYGITDKDVTYFYYSGHGASGVRAQRGALVGVDYFTTNSSSSLVTVDELRGYLDRVPGTVVVVVDSCLSGQLITAKGATTAPRATKQDAQSFEQSMIDVFSAPSVQSKGLNSLIGGNPNKSKYKIAVACQPLEESWADANASVFTYYLLEAAGIAGDNSASFVDMGRFPDKADANRNGYLTLKEAFTYANPLIVRWGKNTYQAEVQNMMIWPKNDCFPLFARIGS